MGWGGIEMNCRSGSKREGENEELRRHQDEMEAGIEKRKKKKDELRLE